MSNDKYEDSSEFTADLSRLQTLSEEMRQIIAQPRFKQWIAITKQNFGGGCEEQFQEAQSNIESAESAIDRLANELYSLG